MSAAVGSGKQPHLFNEENEALYDPYLGFAVNNQCGEVPWPEWSDDELNAEVWDDRKVGRTSTTGLKGTPQQTALFDDPDPPELPPELSAHVHTWRRPQLAFPGAALTVFDSSNAEFELRVESELSDCTFFRAFVNQTTILHYHAMKHGYQVEMETPSFVSNTQGEPWRPWHHVYAMCKAGKGQVHKPVYCPYGKYVVRLFYMGAWRRFVVDDNIPCDLNGKCMLPTTKTPGELWPIVLSKAFLKILSLTPADFPLADFNLLTALTGWTHASFATENKTYEQVWRRLSVLVPRYEQKNEEPEKPATPKVATSSRKESRMTSVKEEKEERFCFLLANLMGFPAEDLTVDCSVAVTLTRDCPLVKAEKREGTKPWKRIRWTDWAKEKGLWVDENQLPPYLRVQIITFFPELSEMMAPDPKLELVLYDIPLEDTEEEMPGEGGKLFEPEPWCDFFKLLEYLTSVNVFFKPSYFTSTFRITCLRKKTVESPPVGKASSKAAPPPSQNSLVFSTLLKPTFNEPVYLLCEATTGIFLCVSLWVCPKYQKEDFGYLEADQPKILKVGHGGLIVESYDWRLIREGKIIGLTKTVGYSSVALNLKPGRHVLKLWIVTDSPYVVDVSSNVNVVVSKRPKIRFLMNAESQLVVQYINTVSDCFMSLTQKFGKPDLPSALREFYDTIKPGNDSVRNYHLKLDEFIEVFLNCIMLSLKDLIPSTEEVTVMMWALRSLFLNPNIRCDLPPGGPPPSISGSGKKPPAKKITLTVKERTLSEILTDLSEETERVITVQRIFRGYRVRLLWKYQTPGRKEFKPFGERLKKICDAVFAPPKREVEVGKLLRRIVMTKPDLLTTFKFHADFSNVLQVEEFGGKMANVEAFAWVPIARFVIACHGKEPVPCAFYLSCNLEQTVVQGFDNDTGYEVFRVSNTVYPHYYRSNTRGYTILVFGWNEANPKHVNWRLEMVKMKYFEAMHLCNILTSSTCQPCRMPGIDVFEIRNFYIPNRRSRIFRCLIKIQKRTLLTLRVSLSYSDVKFWVVISSEDSYAGQNRGRNGEWRSESTPVSGIIAQVVSTNGAVIMPSLVLEYVESSLYGESHLDNDATVYVVEAYVLDNTWPLTKQEWGLVEPLRVNGESWKDSTMSLQSKRGVSESRKKLARTSRKSMRELKVENPFWLLQALNDHDQTEPTVIEEDKKYAESVKAMKMYWEEKDPGRRRRGRELRMKFVHELYQEERRKHFRYGENYGEVYDGEDTPLDPQLVLDQLSDFTYLTSNTSPTRYITSPRILPVTPLMEILCRYRAPTEVASKSKDSQSTDDATEFSLRGEDDLVDNMDDERKDFLRQCLHYRSVMAIFMNEELKLSNRLMEQAYETRAKLLERLMR